MEKELFVRLPLRAIMDERLHGSALIIYALLIDAADENGIAAISLDELSSRSNRNEKTVRRAERVLMDAGYITVYRTGRESLIAVHHGLQPMRRGAVARRKHREEAAG